MLPSTINEAITKPFLSLRVLVDEQQMLKSIINDAIRKLFLSLRVLVDENLTLKMKRYDWWILLANSCQGNLHHFIHHPSKHFSSYMIYNFGLKMENIKFQTSFWAYKMLLPCMYLLYEYLHPVLYKLKTVWIVWSKSHDGRLCVGSFVKDL